MPIVAHDSVAAWVEHRWCDSGGDSLVEPLMGSSLVVVDEELLEDDRGRDGDCSPPPAQIPASGTTALGVPLHVLSRLNGGRAECDPRERTP
jgi:hypothetical protein